MKKENEERLLKRYPELYRQRHLPMTETCMCWGFDVGDGWYKILAKLSKKLDAYAKEKAIKLEVTQVKEKFGTLRFYLNQSDDAIDKMVAAAEAASSTTCEVCGSVYRAKLNNGPWYKVRCEKCRKEEKKKA